MSGVVRSFCLSISACRDSGAPAVGYYQSFLSLNFGPRRILGLQRCWVLPDLFIAFGKAVWTACTLDFSWDTPWWLSLAGLPGTCLGSSWACFGPCAASWKHWAQNTTIFGSMSGTNLGRPRATKFCRKQHKINMSNSKFGQKITTKIPEKGSQNRARNQ